MNIYSGTCGNKASTILYPKWNSTQITSLLIKELICGKSEFVEMESIETESV